MTHFDEIRLRCLQFAVEGGLQGLAAIKAAQVYYEWVVPRLPKKDEEAA